VRVLDDLVLVIFGRRDALSSASADRVHPLGGAAPAPRRTGHLGDAGTLDAVPVVVVDVVLKPVISDPQGQAVLGALGRLGHPGVRSVRQGKHFVLEVDGDPDEAELRKIAETLLANPVIEDVELHLPTH
jgi:phosphoribosylformylglycinamidine synthase PurS subunit